MLDINTIYNEDCLEGMKRIDDKSIDMICTDLPYHQTSRNTWDQIIPFEPLLNDIEFLCCNYNDFANYENCLFYFDPPYFGTKQYSKQSIDYNSFYDFLRKLSENNIVLVSEYGMPDDFTCIWQKERKVLQKSDRITGEKAVEKLFTLKK